MSVVVYSRRAQRDIDSIRRRLGREAGLRTALQWVQRLRQVGDALTNFSERGAVDHEIKRRRLVVAPYLIIYDVERDGQVLIVAVVDGRRDLPKLFR